MISIIRGYLENLEYKEKYRPKGKKVPAALPELSMVHMGSASFLLSETCTHDCSVLQPQELPFAELQARCTKSFTY